MISIFVVGGIVAFFLMKKRKSRRSLSDIEKLDNQPFTALASNEVQGKICIIRNSLQSFASVCPLCLVIG